MTNDSSIQNDMQKKVREYLNSRSISELNGIYLLSQFSAAKRNSPLDNLLAHVVCHVLALQPYIAKERLIGYFSLEEILSLSKNIPETVVIHSEPKDNMIRRYQPPAVMQPEQFIALSKEILSNVRFPCATLDTSRFFTFGSCFATNFARVLKNFGFLNVFSSVVSEEVNSSINNYLLLNYLINGQRSELIDDLYLTKNEKLPDMNAFNDSLAKASHIVFTMGTTYYLLSKSGMGTTIFSKNALRMRSLNYAEHVDYMRKTFALIRKVNPSADILLSVSPIPLKGVLGDLCPYQSDTLSKSIIRASVDEIFGKDKKICYVPTYEIFRSLAPHCGFAVFGADDGNPRHIVGPALEEILGIILRKMISND